MSINVGVCFGGRSVEHEISVISALQAINALEKEKYTIVPVYISKKGKWYTGDKLLDVSNYKDLDKLLTQCEEVFMAPVYGDNNLYSKKKQLFGTKVVAAIDVVLPVLHGTNGEDGVFQGLLELIGIPYVGCNPLASANGMDKINMKMILHESGIPVINYIWFTDKEWFANKDELIAKIEKEIKYPVIVKPANLGSSVGISSGKDRDGLVRAIENAEKFSSRIIVEKMVVAIKEINCSVLGDYTQNKASVCEEPVKSGDILSYEDKYMSGGGKSSKGMQSTKRRIPADLPQATSKKIQHMASETFRVLSCNGVSRIDFIIDESTGEIFVNEINTIPGSLSFYLWEASGLSFDKLMDELIRLALKRDREIKLKTYNYDQNIFNIKGGTKGKF
ncbi:D-alanine--D-alanine ligase [Bacteroidia bacterium]|nr:D-alanine--D-alanine ligase [Bacteroidia bacterium]GHV07620.1 D-alanine--D-alanine ligase [Bacteroidia bacterium]